MGRIAGALVVAVGVLVTACGGGDGDGASEPSAAPAQTDCPLVDSGWVAAWGAPPSGASRGAAVSDRSDASGNPKSTTRDETTRAVLTPSGDGAEARVRLSNRFGARPVTFAHVTIARPADGAAVAAETITPVTFEGRPSVVAEPGADVVSDPVTFEVVPFEPIAVSVHVAGEAGLPTEHFTARQTSYLTAEDAGDHAADPGPEAFSESTTTRPFVIGVDVRGGAVTGAVVALGDSITDGYQGEGTEGVPESEEGLDGDTRYPDELARRLAEAQRPLAVVNAGISGNRVLRAGADGPLGDAAGPALVDRLDEDVLTSPAVTTVILLAGINDLGMAPAADAAAIIDGYERLIADTQAAGIRVLQATLTPASGGPGPYGTAATEAERQQINDWIRTRSPADGVIDFDAAVRDPDSPERLAPALDAGDHLHLDPAGNRALADAVPLDQLVAEPREREGCDPAA